MNQIYQKEKIIQLLITAAKEYNNLIPKEIILNSDEFQNSKTYILRFYKTNFLHLTGAKTKLSPKDFFEKSLNKTISTNDINDIESTLEKYKIIDKLNCLQEISKCFDNILCVQENFTKNTIACTLATTDGNKTIGFIKAGCVNRPMTLLDKNKLNPNKPIYRIKPIIKK